MFTNYSYSGANVILLACLNTSKLTFYSNEILIYLKKKLFPFDGYHEMFFSRKHDLLDLTYAEFKDLLYMPINWFAKIHEKNPDLKYPGEKFLHQFKIQIIKMRIFSKLCFIYIYISSSAMGLFDQVRC